MADKVDEQPSKKSKRRLRAAPVTMREQAEQVAAKAEAASNKKPRRSLRKPKAERIAKPKRKIFAPLRAIWRPIRWLGRHIIPRYFKSAFHELRLTEWPNRKQSRQLTTAVVLFALVFGTFVFFLDFGLDKLFKELFVK